MILLYGSPTLSVKKSQQKNLIMQIPDRQENRHRYRRETKVRIISMGLLSGPDVSNTTYNNTLTSYLDLLLSVGRDGKLHTSIYNKHDDFNFDITNFHYLSSNIPSSMANGLTTTMYIIFPGLLLIRMLYFEGQATFQ